VISKPEMLSMNSNPWPNFAIYMAKFPAELFSPKAA